MRSLRVRGRDFGLTDPWAHAKLFRCYGMRTKPEGKSRVMSTIEEVRAAEKKVQEVLEALKEAGAQDPSQLSTDLQNATDEYARVVRELR